MAWATRLMPMEEGVPSSGFVPTTAWIVCASNAAPLSVVALPPVTARSVDNAAILN